MSLFNRQDAQSREERQPEVPRVQIQGEAGYTALVGGTRNHEGAFPVVFAV